MSWIARLAALLVSAAACAACGSEETITPIPYEPPDDRGPAAWRWLELNAFEFVITNTGSRTFHEPAAMLARGGSVLFDSGLWIGIRTGGAARVSATSYFGSEFRPLLLPDSTRSLVYVLMPGTTPDDPDYDRWPVEAGAPATLDSLPRMLGSGTAWTAHDDLEATRHRLMHSAPIGAEVRQTTWGDASADSVLYQRYEIANVSGTAWTGALFGIWADADLGGAQNDLVGCDPERGLGYIYNGAAHPETVWGVYQPAFGFQLLDTPGGAGLYAFPRVVKNTTEPLDADDAFNLLQGLEMSGEAMVDPFTMEPTRFNASGDPVTGIGWIETVESDRRMLLVTGPADVAPGQTVSLTYAIVFARAVDRVQALTALRRAADALPR